MPKFQLTKLAGLVLCCSALFFSTTAEAARQVKNTKFAQGEEKTTQVRDDEPRMCLFDIPSASSFAKGSWDFTAEIKGAGFVCLFSGQGPEELVYADRSYSILKVPVEAEDGTQAVLTLRGWREGPCSAFSMNSGVACEVKGTFLTIQYYPEDNIGIELSAGQQYVGAMPIQKRQWYDSSFQENAIVIITIHQ